MVRYTGPKNRIARKFGVNRRTQLRWEQVKHLTGVTSRIYRTNSGQTRRHSNKYFLFGTVKEVAIQIMSHKEPVSAVATRGKQPETGKYMPVSDLLPSRTSKHTNNLGVSDKPLNSEQEPRWKQVEQELRQFELLEHI